ncbi:MAG: hypothetical protein ACTSQE_06285 [Candidatus Heimdallarchaeaceae archaeon]
MKIWKCSIESIDEEGMEQVIDLEFADYSDTTNKNIILKEEYFKQLVAKTEINEKYRLSGGMVKLIDPEGKDYSQYSFFAILGVDAQNFLIGILIGELEENQYKLVGFYPSFLKNELQKDPNSLRGLPVLLLEHEDTWKSVNVIAPSLKNSDK